MRLPAFLLSAIFLMGCQTTIQPIGDDASSSVAAPASTGSGANVAVSTLTVRIQKYVQTDSGGTIHTKASLTLSGALNRTIELGDILGELHYINPNAYARFNSVHADTVAAFTSSWKGKGEEFFITQFHDPHTFTVEYRYGDESGICNPPELLIDLPLPGDVRVIVDHSGLSTVDRSSIDGPCKAP
jgi:hypothetical protein